MNKIRNNKTCLHYCTGVMLLMLCCGQIAQADALIDYVDTSADGKKEIIDIVFNWPVQHLYHTPKVDTKSMLLGFYINLPRNQGRSWQRPVPFKHEKLLQSIDVYYEKGFNPHLYFEFNAAVDIEVQPRKDLRGFIIMLSEHENK